LTFFEQACVGAFGIISHRSGDGHRTAKTTFFAREQGILTKTHFQPKISQWKFLVECSNVFTLCFLEIAMGVTTLSSREFNQHASEAKQATSSGPVFITDRGKLAHVLLNIDDYRKLVGAQVDLAQALASPTGGKFKFTPPRMSDKIRPADLS
jgi:hypothetical protein